MVLKSFNDFVNKINEDVKKPSKKKKPINNKVNEGSFVINDKIKVRSS